MRRPVITNASFQNDTNDIRAFLAIRKIQGFKFTYPRALLRGSLVFPGFIDPLSARKHIGRPSSHPRGGRNSLARTYPRTRRVSLFTNVTKTVDATPLFLNLTRTRSNHKDSGRGRIGDGRSRSTTTQLQSPTILC